MAMFYEIKINFFQIIENDSFLNLFLSNFFPCPHFLLHLPHSDQTPHLERCPTGHKTIAQFRGSKMN